jgi:hypothetical protein
MRDVGSRGFRSDIDVTFGPRDATQLRTPEEVARAVEQSGAAARRFNEVLRDMIGGEPDVVLDTNAYTFTGAEARLDVPAAQAETAARVMDATSLAEVRRGMDEGRLVDVDLNDPAAVETARQLAEADWERFRSQALERAALEPVEGAVVSPEQEARAAEHRSQLVDRFDAAQRIYDDVVAREQQTAERLRTGERPPEGEALVARAREEAATELRSELLSELGRRPIDFEAVRNLQARIKLLEPGAYATPAAFADVVAHQQVLAGAQHHARPGEMVTHPRTGVESRLGSEVRDPRLLAQSAGSSLGQLVAHLHGGLDSRLKAIAKYCARIDHSRMATGRATAVPEIRNNFSLSRLLGDESVPGGPPLERMVLDWVENTAPPEIREGVRNLSFELQAEEFITQRFRWAQQAVVDLNIQSMSREVAAPATPGAEAASTTGAAAAPVPREGTAPAPEGGAAPRPEEAAPTPQPGAEAAAPRPEAEAPTRGSEAEAPTPRPEAEAPTPRTEAEGAPADRPRTPAEPEEGAAPRPAEQAEGAGLPAERARQAHSLVGIDDLETARQMRDDYVREDREWSPLGGWLLRAEWEAAGGTGRPPLAWVGEEGRLWFDSRRVGLPSDRLYMESWRRHHPEPPRITDAAEVRRLMEEAAGQDRQVARITNEEKAQELWDNNAGAGDAPLAFVLPDGELVVNMQALRQAERQARQAAAEAPVPRTREEAEPAPQPEEQAPTPRPEAEAPTPRTEEQATIPSPEAEAPTPRTEAEAPTPRPEAEAPTPRTEAEGAPADRPRAAAESEEGTAPRPAEQAEPTGLPAERTPQAHTLVGIDDLETARRMRDDYVREDREWSPLGGWLLRAEWEAAGGTGRPPLAWVGEEGRLWFDSRRVGLPSDRLYMESWRRHHPEPRRIDDVAEAQRLVEEAEQRGEFPDWETNNINMQKRWDNSAGEGDAPPAFESHDGRLVVNREALGTEFWRRRHPEPRRIDDVAEARRLLEDAEQRGQYPDWETNDTNMQNRWENSDGSGNAPPAFVLPDGQLVANRMALGLAPRFGQEITSVTEARRLRDQFRADRNPVVIKVGAEAMRSAAADYEGGLLVGDPPIAFTSPADPDRRCPRPRLIVNMEELNRQ